MVRPQHASWPNWLRFARFEPITGLADKLYNTAGRDPPSENQTDSVQVHLHELAEGLQAVSSYFEAFQQRLREADDNQAVEPVAVQNMAQQLERVNEAFRRLRDQLLRS